MSSTVLAILYAVHLLAAVVWIGGLLMLALVVIPGARRVLDERSGDGTALETSSSDAVEAPVLSPAEAPVLSPAEAPVLSPAEAPVLSPAEALLAELERRFTPLANLSLVVLIVTGMLQMSADENYAGFLRFDNTWAWAMLFKHLAVIGMALVAGYAALGLEPERRRLQTLAAAGRLDPATKRHLARRRSRLAGLNLGCGLLTLLFTAVATAQ